MLGAGLLRPSIISEGATICAPAWHYRSATHLVSAARTYLSVIQRHFRYPLDARCSVYCAVLIEQTTVTVIGILAEADIAGHDQIWEFFAQ